MNKEDKQRQQLKDFVDSMKPEDMKSERQQLKDFVDEMQHNKNS